MQTILAIDDEYSVRQSYRLILSQQYKVVLAENGQNALDILEQTDVDMVLLDLMMPGMHGLDVLSELTVRDPSLPVVVVTALNSVSTAVDAMRRGARDYTIKPFDVDDLLLLVERILSERRDHMELQVLRDFERSGFESIVGNSGALFEALTAARHAVNVDSTVLITGESGTGKDMLARAIHSAGPRAGMPFVHVSCCAIPATLFESDLFGHEKGAFTGATDKQCGKLKVADGGTLFLDEIGEMPLEAQAKLLRVLQDGAFYPVGSAKIVEVDVRFICATNRNLHDAISQRAFRQDLFYRINVVPVEMPPLRRRREDVPDLVAHFIAKQGPKVGSHAKAFSQEALNQMAAYDWPGNVRELENVVHRVLLYHAKEEIIRPEHLAGALPQGRHTEPAKLTEFEGLSLEEATGSLEKHLIEHALKRSDYVQSRAADLLGTTRRVLKYKMDQLGISAEPDEPDSSRRPQDFVDTRQTN